MDRAHQLDAMCLRSHTFSQYGARNQADCYTVCVNGYSEVMAYIMYFDALQIDTAPTKVACNRVAVYSQDRKVVSCEALLNGLSLLWRWFHFVGAFL